MRKKENTGSIRASQSLFSIIAPGILLAATGVGAGDLMTTSLAGSEVGLGIMWAVVTGAVFKFALTEGIARWWLATQSNLLEGWTWWLGGWIRWAFFAYLLLFTLVLGGALATACGVAGSALFPLGDPVTSRIFWGVFHSMLGLILVWHGSFALFQKLMTYLVGIMFAAVTTTAILIGPDWSTVANGFIPSIPTSHERWILAVIGGVGGTVTLLSYGYWMREIDRRNLENLRICRIDLAVGNGLTALFGMSALIIGSAVQLKRGGADLPIQMAHLLQAEIGSWGYWIFLAGFWGAVFSSLLGAWQSVPYMFADFLELGIGKTPGLGRKTNLRNTKPYRWYLVFIATLPLLFLWVPIQEIQLAYGMIGSLFLPLLALTLLMLNNRRRLVGPNFLNRWLANGGLVATLLFFAYMGAWQIYQQLAEVFRIDPAVM